MVIFDDVFVVNVVIIGVGVVVVVVVVNLKGVRVATPEKVVMII